MIKISLTTMCSLFLSFVMASHSVASTDNTLKSIYDMRTITFGILGDYYMFSGLEGDSRYNREIEAGIKRFEAQLGNITQDGTPTAKLSQLASTKIGRAHV